MKQAVNILTAVLLAVLSMAFVGCSQDDDFDATDSNSKTSKKGALTKEQLVGMWRNGDEWLSIDGEGREHVDGEPLVFSLSSNPYYYTGRYKFVVNIDNEEALFSGKYCIEGNIIIGLATGLGDSLVVTSIDSASISLDMTFEKWDKQDHIYKNVKASRTFWKTDEAPITKKE